MNLYRILHKTFSCWIDDEAPMMGAALAYYCLFSIAPLLLVALTIAGIIFGPEAARGELSHHLTAYFGENGAQSVQALLSGIEKSQGSGLTTVIIGIVVTIFGASSVFNQLKLSLNRIWHVHRPRFTGFTAIVINRLVAILMVLVVGLFLISSIVISAIVSRVVAFTAEEFLPVSPALLRFMDLGIAFLLLTALFAVIFRYFPDVRMGWRSVFLGAVVTSVLFGIGRFLISFYIAHSATTSAYGAAGSIIVLLLWIYYSAQIFLFGAEFTRVYSQAMHLPAQPICDEDQLETEKPETALKP